MKKNMGVDSVSSALREVKEYSTRTSDFNVDTLQLKLMHLDEVARRNQHPDRELFSSALERFLCHKKHPKIGFLISSILSNQAESKILKKEQKFLKLHGKDVPTEDQSPQEKTNNLDQFTNFLQAMQSFMLQARGPRGPYNPRPTFGYPPRQPMTQGRFRFRPQYTGCFTCGDTSHIRANCPQNK